MADVVTKVTTQSWGGRIKNAIGGVVVGLGLFVVAFPLLFWNEGRAVKRYKSLKEGQGVVISILPEVLSTNNEGRLVHTSGLATTEERLRDREFDIAENALRLRRTAQMYQWTEEEKSETRKKVGGSEETVTTYTYSKEWREELIKSSDFEEQAGHINPGEMPYRSLDMTTEEATLGAFRLPVAMVERVDAFEDLPVPADARPPREVRRKGQAYNGGFYVGENPEDPQVGDLRISFSVVRPTTISVVAQQDGNTFKPYLTKAGGTLDLLETGTRTAEEMFTAAHEANKFLTWILRVVGFFCMFVGLLLFFKPLSVLADVLPFLGSIVGAGAALVAFLVAAPLSLITIAVAWFFYRPLLSILVLLPAVLLIVLLVKKLRKKKAT
jgi:hypothetical protein